MTPPLTDAELLAYIERTEELSEAFHETVSWVRDFDPLFQMAGTRKFLRGVRAFHANEQRVRDELTRQLFREAAHIAENAGALAKMPGMTLRDYFAAKVMQGMWACADVRGNSEALARGAYEMADAMLKEREK